MNPTFPQKENANDPALLSKYGRNLTDLALKAKLDPIIGREAETRRVINILSRRTKNNPVLVGDPGVGKTAIVEGLAWRIVKGEVPDILKNKEIYELSMSSLIAGTSFHGQFEERLLSVINKVKESDGQIIVFIDEIHTLIGAGKTQGSMDAANILKPMLARGEIRLIGATTLDEYSKHIEKDAALERRLQKVMVEEPTVAEAVTILRGIAPKYEQYHGVRIHDNALNAAVQLSMRYITDRFLPDKAIDLIDEAAAMVKTEIESMPVELEEKSKNLMHLKVEQASLKNEKDAASKKRLREIEVIIEESEKKVSVLMKQWEKERAVLSEVQQLKEKIDSGQQNSELLQAAGEYEKASKLLYVELPKWKEELIKKEEQVKTLNLIQEEVTTETIAKVVSKWKGIPVSSIATEDRQILTNLFNELKKSVKGQDRALDAVSKTIQRQRSGISNPNRPLGSFMFLGQTGVGKTEVARALARALFNSEKEMIRIDMSEYAEKHSISKLIGAPPGYIGFEQSGLLTKEVRNKPYAIVLFDEVEKAHPDVFNALLAILEDGRLTDGHGRLVDFKNTVIIMTTNAAQNKVGTSDPLKILSALETYFKPEFLNRIDEIIPFNELTDKVVYEIVEKEIGLLSDRLSNLGYRIKYTKPLKDVVMKEGYDVNFGARPLRRYITKNIENLIAEKIVNGDIIKNKSYTVDYVDKTIVVTKAESL